MTRPAAGIALALALAPLGAQTDSPPSQVRLELTAAPEAWVGQRVPLRIVVDVDRTFRDASMIQLFRQRLGLPVQIEAPWLSQPPAGCAIALPPPADLDEPSARVRIALADRIVLARQLDGAAPDRERFVVHAYLVAGAPGPLRLRGTTARYAYGTRFREDFVNGRVAEDRIDARAAGPDITIDVRPLPGPAPERFTGAVGQFELSATAPPEELAVGDGFELELTIGGSGNFGHFGPPDLSGQGGLHVLSIEEDLDPNRVRAVYRLRADRPSDALPALTWPAFDPTTGAYVTLRTEPLATAVRAGDGSTAAQPDVDAPRWRTQWTGPDGDHRHLSAWALGIAALGPWLAVGGLWLWRRRRAAIAADPMGHRARTALANLRAALASDGADPEPAFAEFVAARLRCPRSAVVGGAVAERLRQAGAPAELAQQTQDLLGSLSDHRYAGGAASHGAATRERILDIAARLDQTGGTP